MAEKLTPQQKMAVEDRGGKLLVSAAAGSGKTKVLVDRLLSYITDPIVPANVDDFLIITYTKAAAAELRGKIADKLNQRIAEEPGNRHLQQQMQRLYLAKISTVHSFCADILREYAYKLDISADFRIAEENECQQIKEYVIQQILDEAYARAGEDLNFTAFVDSQGLGRDDRLVPEIILQIHSSALCHLDPQLWLSQCASDLDMQSVNDVTQTKWGAFLVEDLKQFLNLQIHSLESCIECGREVPGMEKPVTLLKDTVLQLCALRDCSCWDDIVNHPAVSFGTLSFKKEHRGSVLAEQMKAVRNHCKTELAKKLRAFSDSSERALHHQLCSASAAMGLISLVKQFIQEFDRIKKTRRILDFSDIEQKTLDLLLGKKRSGATTAAHEIGKRFREIMVDEYQDSNEVQDAIFTALTQNGGSCFMVGDVKQSIYQFRLADPGIFLDKYHRFAPADEAEPGQGRKVLLSSNFRSSGGVIAAVNDVFSTNMSRVVGGLEYNEAEMLREGIPHIDLPDPEVELYGIQVREDTYEEEAAFTAQRISQLLDGKHMIRQGDTLRAVEPGDIVILLRSPGSVGAEFQYALESRGIRCALGSGGDLLQEGEVEVLRSLLQIISNPLQDIPLIAVLTSPLFGFTADDLAKLRGKNRKASIYELLQKDTNERTVRFLAVLNELREEARFLTVTQLLDLIFIKTGIRNVYGAMKDGQLCCRNLNNFLQLAVSFEAQGRKELSFFLEYLEMLDVNGFNVPEDFGAENCVRIMSIHKSKGLEFPVVFLCGLSRRFNTSDTKKQVLCHKELGLGLSAVNDRQRVRFPTVAKRAIAAKIMKESVSEEMRVLYVALTRARDRLIMTYADANLEDTLRDLAMRMDHSHTEAITMCADCPGIWILHAALRRSEAGAFFALGGYPQCRSVSAIPWKISVSEAPAVVDTAVEENSTPVGLTAEQIERLRESLGFRYPFDPVTQIPSKLTVTQIKGRFKDAEVIENSDSERHNALTFRSPHSIAIKKGIERGNATHILMQYIRFSACTNSESVDNEVKRLVSNGLITQEQGELVDSNRIAEFFGSPLGQKVLSASEVLREFKFSVLENADSFYADSADEKVLLQGVVDCAILEDDGITIIDFKTDYVTDQTIDDKVREYTQQVNTYSHALARIFERPVKDTYLYFFHNGTTVHI